MVRNKAARQFLREVKALLPDTGKQKKPIANRISTTVEELLTENPNAGYDEIVSRLGSPNQIAASCLEEMEAPELMKKLRVRKKVVCIVAAAAVAVVLLWAGVVSVAVATLSNGANGYFAEEIEDVNRTED